MNKEYVSFELATIAKKKGFETTTMYSYTYKQLVEWIFSKKDIHMKRDSASLARRSLFLLYVGWLEFWYDTLIPEIKDNEFVLEGFIGMLMNFFENEGTIISLEYDYVTWDVNISRYGMETIELQSTLTGGTSYRFLKKKDAIHAGIKTAFKLLKEENGMDKNKGKNSTL